MKKLNKFIQESLLDDEEDLINDASLEDIQWVKKNYNIYGNGKNSEFTIKNGILNAPDIHFTLEYGHQLTNGNFKFGEVESFSCGGNRRLKSLEGGPTKTKTYFSCGQCSGLKDLKGAPEYVGTEFDCNYCENLESLKGSPKYVGKDFNCHGCSNLKDLKGITEVINGSLDIRNCEKLNPLIGLPKKIGFELVMDWSYPAVPYKDLDKFHKLLSNHDHISQKVHAMWPEG